MVMNEVERAETLLNCGSFREGLSVLAHAARKNDPEALIALATIALRGDIVRRDLPLSRELFRQAADAGSIPAGAAYRAFVANGTGGPADWKSPIRLLEQAAIVDPQAQRELTLIAAMQLSDTGEPLETFSTDRLSDSPEATIFPSLFSEAECGFLFAPPRSLLQRSRVVDPETGDLVANPVRTSDAASIPWVTETPAIHALCRRLAKASGTTVKQGEPLQILRYRSGEEYRPHFDALEGVDNQRVLTFLVYLNDDFDGGETCFMHSGLAVKGRTGDGLMFRNADHDGRSDPHSQHAGLPVLRGEKYVASRWIRQRPFGAD